MALDIKGLKRVFILKKGNGTLTLEDPDSRMSLSEVTDFYSINYPELTTATLHGPELEEDRVRRNDLHFFLFLLRQAAAVCRVVRNQPFRDRLL